MLVNLKPLEVRKESVEQVIERLRASLAKIHGIRTFFVPAQDIQIGASGGLARYQYALTGLDKDEVSALEPHHAARTSSSFRRLPTPYGITTPAASRRPVRQSHARGACGRQRGRPRQHPLRLAWPASDQNDPFPDRFPPGRYSRSNRASGRSPKDLTQTSCSSRAFRRMQSVRAAASIRRCGSPTFRSCRASLSASTRRSVFRSARRRRRSSRQKSMSVFRPTSGRNSEARRTKREQTRSTQPFLFLAATIAVYIILGMLYESYAHPFTILSTLPSATLGAMLALMATRTQFTLITAIACILLVGIVMKNAIMMVDFALDAERRRAYRHRRRSARSRTAVSPDRDDDDGCARRGVAVGARHRTRLGTSAAAWHRDRRRPVAVAICYSLYDPGRLPGGRCFGAAAAAPRASKAPAPQAATL